MQESSLILKTMKEERKGCLRERSRDGLKTIHTSSEALLKKNNSIETTSRLI